MDEKEHDINDSFNPVKPPHVGWLSNHHLLGGFILFAAFAAVVAYLYYLSTLQVNTENFPMQKNLVSLEGNDYDHDGVRDDVQAFIIENYSDGNLQLALFQLAKAQQAAIVNSDVQEVSSRYINDAVKAIDCIYYVDSSRASIASTEIEARMTNTEARLHAYLKANNSAGSDSPKNLNANRDSCNFKLDSIN